MELLLVVLLLSIIVGALFSQLERAQVRYRVEDQQLDLTQQEREFIDQFTRDLHQAGYPSMTVFGTQYDLTSNHTAAGVWSISDTEIHMEGDVDGDGIQHSRRARTLPKSTTLFRSMDSRCSPPMMPAVIQSPSIRRSQVPAFSRP